MSACSWYSGLRCSSCGEKVLTGPQHSGLFRAKFDDRGRRVVKAEAICGACRRSKLEEKVA